MTYGRPDPYPPPLTLRDAPRTGLLTNQTDAEPLPSGDLDQRKTQWLAIESHADAAEGLLEKFSQLGIMSGTRQEQNAPERQKKTAIHRSGPALQKTLQTVATNRRFGVLVSN